jgi:hypothetical protein
MSTAAEIEERSDAGAAPLQASFEAGGRGLMDRVLLFATFNRAIRAVKASWSIIFDSLVWRKYPFPSGVDTLLLASYRIDEWHRA